MNWRDRAQTLRALPLTSILALCGARLDPHDPRKWHTPQGVLTVTGAKFMNWNLGQGGGGAIDLVMHLQRLGFGQALEWLESHCAAVAPLPVASAPPPPLALPQPDREHLHEVRRYLIHQRRLPPALLEPLIHAGTLYADARANAVFLHRDCDGQPVGAELRGTTACAWRGMAPGSRKDLGFFAIPAEPAKANVLCESAIDAISCHAMHPGFRCVSTAGARPNPAWLAHLISQSLPLFCGFDLDDTGEAMARSLISLHPSVQRLRPARKDWNDVLCWTA